ncbi:MAG: AbgT family transporter [Verrucomicrobiae bacterium]|nr:AbgT family transporter [Verrucomicrobiae bacterium]
MNPADASPAVRTPSRLARVLNRLERAGNRLPDPVLIFVWALAAAWIASTVLSQVAFTDPDPRTFVRDAAGQVVASSPITIRNLLAPAALTTFLSRMVRTFTEFPPLGVVLVAMLGVGVAEQTGFVHAAIKSLLRITPRALLSPMLLLVALLSHSAGDTGYVLVVPLGGLLFAAVGRHPVAGIACAFAGVAAGFSASFLPSTLDPLLQGFTQSAARILDPGRQVNPLCNWYFMSGSSLLILGVGWWLTDRLIEPRLRAGLPVDTTEPAVTEGLGKLTDPERKGLLWGGGSAVAVAGLVTLACLPAASPFRAPDGGLTSHGAPLMDSIVPLIALGFFIPAVAYGYGAGTVRSHRDVVQGMARSMNTMGYYLVMAFCAAQFTYAFRESNLGALLAIRGADLLQRWSLPGGVTVVGIILLAAAVNLLIGSASAKWALLAPVLVPMLMQLKLSPELTQAAFRIGDSSTNVITPLFPYFPLIVAYCQRYSRTAGMGTLIASMLPYCACFLVLWTVLLLAWWGLGIALGPQATYRL